MASTIIRLGRRRSAPPSRGSPGNRAMTDAKVQEIQDAVDKFLAANRRRMDSQHPQTLSEDMVVYVRTLFEEMVEYVRSNVSWRPKRDKEDEFRMVVAMCWLGPDGHGIPPAHMRRDLLQIIHAAVPDAQQRVKRVLEFAIAYGCGWGRQPAPGGGTWANRWGSAVTNVIAQLMCPHVWEVDRWMAGTLIGYQMPRGPGAKKQALENASLLAPCFIEPVTTLSLGTQDRLVVEHVSNVTQVSIVGSAPKEYPVFAGARFLFEFAGTGRHFIDSKTAHDVAFPESRVLVLARDDDTWVTRDGGPRITVRPDQRLEAYGPGELTIWECTCGHRDCSMRHRIDKWDAKFALWDFIASAIKGPDRHLKTGAVIKGMYVPMLSRGESTIPLRVREAEILFKLCPKCHVFDYDKCRKCGAVTYPQKQIRTVTRRALIVVGEFAPPYRPVQRIRCSQRSEHYKEVMGHEPDAAEQLGEDWDNIHGDNIDEEAWDNFKRSPGSWPKCPICGLTPTTLRPTTVWERTFAHNVDFDRFLLLGESNEDAPP